MSLKDLTPLDKLYLWISKNNKARLQYVQPREVANEIDITEKEADDLLSSLVDKGQATRYFIFKCSSEYCQEEIVIDSDLIENRAECELCNKTFVPKENVKNLKYIAYEIYKEKNTSNIGEMDYKSKYFDKSDCGKADEVERKLQVVDNISAEVIPFKKGNDYKIFISHNEKDKGIASKLVKLISDIGVKRSSENIFCSSYPGLGVPVGKTIPQYIREEINGNVIVLMLFSENYYSSAASLCEMGAVWVNSKESIPVIIPPFNFEGIKGFVENNSGVYLTNKQHLNEFRNTIREKFNITKNDSESWEMDRDDFIESVKVITDKTIDS